MQRYLTTPSVDAARESLLMSVYWKIPLQALVLLVGVLMFLFFLYTPSPMLFNRVHEREMREGPHGDRVSRARVALRGGHGVAIRRRPGDDTGGSRRRRAQSRAARAEFRRQDDGRAHGSQRGDRAGAPDDGRSRRTAT